MTYPYHFSIQGIWSIEGAWSYTPLHLAPAGYCGVAEEYTMASYFPQEMLYELWCSYNSIPPELVTAPAPPTNNSAPSAAAESAPNSDANQDTNPQPDVPPVNLPPAGPLPAETRYSVVHIVQYSPWSPTPGDERAESQIIGTFKTSHEANELAMKEVYEKYGQLAHVGRAAWDPPNPTWLRKAGAGAWPNTWKIEDGLLSFSLVSSRLHYTLKGRIYVVKC
jgi:hypothetical protein